MRMDRHVPPTFNGRLYNCPHCGAYAMQMPYDLYKVIGPNSDPSSVTEFSLSQCYFCDKLAIWDTRQEAMVYPTTLPTGPEPNPDLPEDVRNDYEEARLIAATSPRGAAALLRLAIQKLCIHLGGKGKHLDTDIAQLVTQGLSEDVQMMLDSIRVIGNNAVHPGEIDVQERGDLVLPLFGLVNEIADELITRPRRRREIYERLPEGARAAIEQRDKPRRSKEGTEVPT